MCERSAHHVQQRLRPCSEADDFQVQASTGQAIYAHDKSSARESSVQVPCIIQAVRKLRSTEILQQGCEFRLLQQTWFVHGWNSEGVHGALCRRTGTYEQRMYAFS